MRIRALLAVTLAFSLLAGCGGGGGSSVPSGGGGTGGTSYNLGSAQNIAVTGGASATMSFPAASSGGPVTVSSSSGPIGTGTVLSVHTQSATGAIYISLTATQALTVGYPTFTTSDTAIDGVAFATQGGAWNYTLYNETSPGTFTAPGTLTLAANATVYFALYSGTPSSGQSNIAFNCPSSDSSANSIGRASAASEVRMMPHRGRVATPASNLIAVVYDRATYQRSTASFTQSEQSSGSTLTQTFDYAKIGKVVHVLSVPAAKSAAIMAALRAQPGVLTVAATGRRYATHVTTPYWPNDPYFNGFNSPLPAPTALATAAPPATYHVGPYEENSSVPGQWDMHAIGLENAFAYESAANVNSGAGPTNPNALGSSSISIAIIDTGVDTSLPELSGKVTRQRCFITNATLTAQSTSQFVTDPDGHGTDVTGIAAADMNDSLGFVGAGGNTTIWAYRVFPTPDNNCNNPGTADPQCGAATTDIASAIDDAVSAGVNIISMSLGGIPCTSPGVDSDPVEGAAVQNAIASNVIVVAASGNERASTLDTPACDAGVIAVGSTSLDDGQPNGTGSFGGQTSPTPIEIEYVAADYSNYGSPNTLHSGTSWGIVAPGGDPTGNNDNDDLHWIENIWTSTPYESSDAGSCNGDYPPPGTGTSDCRILIAGTSMATPHVAGVAALVLAVGGPSYQNPATMKNFLCSTADNLNAQTGATNSPGTNQGCGRVNAYMAVGTALGDSPLP